MTTDLRSAIPSTVGRPQLPMPSLSTWKTIALNTYYHTTLPLRWFESWRNARARKSPVVVLFYHRVADHERNEWTMSPSEFHRQIDWLRSRFEIVSLDEARQRLRCGFNQHQTVSITFDDGYADNMLEAVPRLIQDNIPFTYFVSTRHVLEQEPFPHDVERGRPLAPNTVEDLRFLVESGVEIGAHTRSHADLGSISDETLLRDELIGSRNDLENALGISIRYFAFPYGQHQNLNPAAFKIARESGLRAVCSAYGGYNFPGDDPFHLQRIHADPEFIRLKNWTTVDPRKRFCNERFDYATG